MRQNIKRPRPMQWVGGGSLAAVAALALTMGSVGARAVPTQSSAPKPQWFVQTALASNFPRLTLSTFQHFAQEGVTGVEVNLSWSGIEPEPGSFHFNALNTYLHYAQETHLKLIPIFWEYISWYPNQPFWLPGGYEQTSLGYPAAEPPLWSHRAFKDYATFMHKTLADAEKSSAFGGAFIDYGWNDAGYGPTSSSGNGFGDGIAGYAPQDVAEFHVWLKQQYGTLAKFDTTTGTTYTQWSAIPAFTPGTAHFAIYQRFRFWSYKDLLGQLLAMARKTTQKTLYIYWGGGIGDASALGNLPDNVFALARQYHAVVDDDNAEHTAFSALFGFLSQEYHVPLLEEQSPNLTGVAQEEAEWLGQYPLEGGDRYGEDYFIYAGNGNESGYFAGTWPKYLAWHAALAKVQGTDPHDAVGIMLGYDQLYAMNSGTGLPGDTTLLGNYLRTERPTADVFTDLSVLNGAVKLNQFKTIVDWNNDLEAPGMSPHLLALLHAFEAHGGKIIPGPAAATVSVASSRTLAGTRATTGSTNLVLNPSGAQGTLGWHLGSASGANGGAMLSVTHLNGKPALQWRSRQVSGQSQWVDYNPAVSDGATYTFTATLSGNGQVRLNFWNGTANVEGPEVTLSKTPQTVSETVTMARKPVAAPQIQVLTPTAENATVDVQDVRVMATSTTASSAPSTPPANSTGSAANLVLNPSGMSGTTGWHLGYPTGSKLGITIVQGHSALQWTVSQTLGHSDWVDYNPAVTPGNTYTYNAMLSGSGTVNLNFWNGTANVEGPEVTLSKTPQAVSETVTIAATSSTSPPQIQVVTPTAENATVDIQDASVAATSAATSPVIGGMPVLPAQFVVSPNNSNVETFASVTPGSAFIVVSNIGTSAFSGSVTIPQAQVATLLPHDVHGLVRSKILLGHIVQIKATSGASWKLSLPASSIGVMEIQPR